MAYAKEVTISGTETIYIFCDEDTKEEYPNLVTEAKGSILVPFQNPQSIADFMEQYNKELSDKVFLVEKNADFTEGRGPMIPIEVFRSRYKAERYISRQRGIYGSAQYRSIVDGININGKSYAFVYWNGYSIKELTLR